MKIIMCPNCERPLLEPKSACWSCGLEPQEYDAEEDSPYPQSVVTDLAAIKVLMPVLNMCLDDAHLKNSPVVIEAKKFFCKVAVGPYCTNCGYLIGEGCCECESHDSGPKCTWCGRNPCGCPGSFESHRKEYMRRIGGE